MKRIVILDSHAIIHRAYHALPPLTSLQGEPVGAVYGFAAILFKMIKDLEPDVVVAAFDTPSPTFRHAAFERYKAQRPETPSDLAGQFVRVKELLEAFRIPVFEVEGYEADDVIGTMAEKLKKEKGIEAIVVTGDMDALQLVRPGFKVYTMKKGVSETEMYDTKAVRARFGFGPERLVDYKGLKGDPSDNIPGVRGIGEKTAMELVHAFGPLEKIFQAAKKGSKKIRPAVLEKLKSSEEEAKFSRELATIHAKAPIDFNVRKLPVFRDGGTPEVRAMLQKFGFTSLLKRFGGASTAEPPRPQGVQTSLGSASSASATRIAEATLASFAALIKKNIGNSSLGLMIVGERLILLSRDARGHLSLNVALLKSPAVKRFFESRNDFLAFDGKRILHFLKEQGIACGGMAFDILLAAYLVEPFSRDFSYAAVCGRELGVFALADDEASVAHFFALTRVLEKKLSEGRMRNVFQDIEMPVMRVLADMEERGILIDQKFLAVLAKDLEKKIAVLVKTIFELAGEDFNVNSSQQLSRILFEKLKVGTKGLRKTEKGGVISTRESELEKLRELHPLVGKMLEYRELAKLKSTYVDTLPALADKKDGRIHTTFNQIGASTGRLSSQNPNLQNIPIMSDYGREVRKAFIAEQGFLLASCDYSQIELRVAAHIADDKKMIEAFRRGDDIHTMTAALVYHVSPDKVTPDLRRAAKTLNFGILYGMGANALAEATGMTQAEAKTFIAEYFKNFSGIRNYIDATKQFAEENGYVETLFGRRRYIPEIHSVNWQVKREAERMAVNMPIQGTATGDIIKMAMIQIDEWVHREKLENDVRMLLQVHDELVFEVKEKGAEKLVEEIKRIMASAAKLKVPLVAEAHIGKSWEK